MMYYVCHVLLFDSIKKLNKKKDREKQNIVIFLLSMPYL